jgi:LmbE family N-acetylglucosaminyl deacetylase
MNKILIVAAHPDDEVLGCGGTIARFLSEGNVEVATLILGEGVTSRDKNRDREGREREIAVLKKNIMDANKILGIEKVFSFDFPDNRFDTVALIDIVKVIEEVKQAFMPDIIFTHFAHDMNVDHAITNKAVLTATRPMADECVKEIYAFEVLSSTEWNFPLSFSPDMFVDISTTLVKKQEAMKVYKSELREFPHPRSIEGISLNAKNWGMKIGLPYGEAFQTLRRVLSIIPPPDRFSRN